MHVFDFFSEFTSTATRAWAFATFATPVIHTKGIPTIAKPTVLELEFSYSPSSTPTTASLAPKSRQPAVHMPLELILLIIEASYDRRHPDKSLLRACSLVCREWSVAVQKLLFRNVTLQTLQAFQSFKRAVDPSTERGAVLGGAVRELRVVVDYSQPSYLHQHALGMAVNMCPNLQELDLSLYGFSEPGDSEDQAGSQNAPRLRRRAPCFDERTLTLLRSGPQIKSLSFSNWSENHECIFQLLDVWPSLRTVSMSGTSPHVPSHASLPYPGKLEDLRMNFQTTPSMEFMNWLLHHSTASLRKVTFERDPCPDLVDFIMDSFAPNLRSLSIPSCSSPDLARRLEHCKDLNFLRMDQPQSNALVYKSLPASINHIAFGVDRDTPLQPVIDLVKSRSGLEMVTIRLWNGGDNHRLLPALKVACAYRGVDLMITNDTLQYESLLLC